MLQRACGCHRVSISAPVLTCQDSMHGQRSCVTSVLFQTRLELCLQTMSSSDAIRLLVWSQFTTSGAVVVKRNFLAVSACSTLQVFVHPPCQDTQPALLHTSCTTGAVVCKLPLKVGWKPYEAVQHCIKLVMQARQGLVRGCLHAL